MRSTNRRRTARCAAHAQACRCRGGLCGGPSTKPPQTGAIIEADDIDESALDDVVLQPPVECLPPEPIDIEAYIAREKELEIREVEAPVVRRVTLSSLMLGTLLVAVCMGLARALIVAGIVAFLVIVPAYIRTLSAISFFRDQERQLEMPRSWASLSHRSYWRSWGWPRAESPDAAVTLVSGLIVGLSGREQPGGCDHDSGHGRGVCDRRPDDPQGLAGQSGLNGDAFKTLGSQEG